MTGETAIPRTRLVKLPGRGTTRVWECAGPHGAQTLMLTHGVTFTAELNWAKVFAPLGRHFRVVAADLRGHGDGIRAGSRFRLEDCAGRLNGSRAAAGVCGSSAGGRRLDSSPRSQRGRRESPAGEPDAPTFTHELLAPQMVAQVPAARDLRLHIVPATALAWEVLQGK